MQELIIEALSTFWNLKIYGIIHIKHTVLNIIFIKKSFRNVKPLICNYNTIQYEGLHTERISCFVAASCYFVGGGMPNLKSLTVKHH